MVPQLGSNTLRMFLHFFRGQLTASVIVDTIKELPAFDDFLAPPVKDAALVLERGGRKLALFWFCTTAWLTVFNQSGKG